MILEATQLLWTAWHVLGGRGMDRARGKGIKVYKATHVNHPMAIWVRRDKKNYVWLVKFALVLAKEYDMRFRCKCGGGGGGRRTYGCKVCPKKVHACVAGLKWMRGAVLRGFGGPNAGEYKAGQYLATEGLPKDVTPIPLCMPEKYFCKNVVTAYRKYACGPEKERFMVWDNAECVPSWWRRRERERTDTQ